MEFNTTDIPITDFWQVFKGDIENFYGLKINYSARNISAFLQTLGLCYRKCISNTYYEFEILDERLFLLTKIKYGI